VSLNDAGRVVRYVVNARARELQAESLVTRHFETADRDVLLRLFAFLQRLQKQQANITMSGTMDRRANFIETPLITIQVVISFGNGYDSTQTKLPWDTVIPAHDFCQLDASIKQILVLGEVGIRGSRGRRHRLRRGGQTTRRVFRCP
jgi:hypothetical protein